MMPICPNLLATVAVGVRQSPKKGGFIGRLTASDVVHAGVNQDHDWVPNSRALLKVLVATSTAVYTDGMPEMGDGKTTATCMRK